MKKRIMSMLLVLCIVLSVIPTTVLAANEFPMVPIGGDDTHTCYDANGDHACDSSGCGKMVSVCAGSAENGHCAVCGRNYNGNHDRCADGNQDSLCDLCGARLGYAILKGASANAEAGAQITVPVTLTNAGALLGVEGTAGDIAQLRFTVEGAVVTDFIPADLFAAFTWNVTAGNTVSGSGSGVQIVAPEAGLTVGTLILQAPAAGTHTVALNAFTAADTGSHPYTEALRTESFTVTVVEKPAITMVGNTLNYAKQVTVVSFFDLTGLEDINPAKDAGILVFNEAQYKSWDKVSFVSARAKTGLKLDTASGRYYAESDGITTLWLHRDYYYVGYVKLADGSYILSQAVPYSAATYATNMLKKDGISPETENLCVALLNHMAEVQKYYYPNSTTYLVNECLTAEQKQMDWANAELNTAGTVPAEKQVEKDTQVFGRTGKNVRFTQMANMTAIFEIDDSVIKAAKLSGVIYWTEEQFAALEGTPSLDNYGGAYRTSMYQYAPGQWAGHSPKIPTKDVADTVYYFLGYVVHKDGTVSYSNVGTYTIEQHIGNTADDPDVGELMRSFYFYERAVKAAFEAA